MFLALALTWGLCIQHFSSSAQTTNPGRVQNEKGEPIPFASVYIEELKQGISANENGNFEFKAPPGTYTCYFQSLGYEMQERQITLPLKETLTVVMAEKAYGIRSISISSDDEDPAYRIMRRAIAKAPYYRSIIKGYTSEVYLKTKIDVDQLKGIAAAALDKQERQALRKLSFVYESVNELRFYAPDRFEQKVKSVIKGSSIDLSQFGMDMEDMKMGVMQLNIYGTSPALPLAPGAFSNYRFEYEGISEQGGQIINKIKVIPRRKDNRLLSGYIYIVEDLWSVYSFDLLQTSAFGTIRIRQSYGDVGGGIFLPVSYNADIHISMLGAKGAGNMTGSVMYLTVEQDKKIALDTLSLASTVRPDATANPPAKISAKREQLQQQLDELAQKDEFRNSDMMKASRIQSQIAGLARKEEMVETGEKRSLEVKERYVITSDSTASKRDSVYWNLVRPVPLLDSEALVYRKNDSIAAANTGQDSVKHKKSAARIITGIVMGDSYRIDSLTRINFGGLMSISSMDFNTVDGFVYGTTGGLTIQRKDRKRWDINIGGSWAFAREKFLWNASVERLYNPRLRAGWRIEGGMSTADFAGAQGVGRVNGWSSLLFRYNYSSFYGNDYIKANHSIDIVNGLTLATGIEWADRHELNNYSDYSLFYRDSRDYRPNIPDNAAVMANPALLADNRAAILDVKLQYTPNRRYRMYNGQKYYLGSAYPTLTAVWKRGIPGVFESGSDFDFLSANIAQSLSFGYFNRLSYTVEAGKFFGNKNTAFADFRHFYANQPGLSLNKEPGAPYQLLPCYTYSTRDWYAAASANYSAPYMLLKRIPFLSNLPFNESIYGSYLLQPQLRHYTEAGYGIDMSGMIGAGVFAGFENGRYRSWGVRISLRLEY